MSWKASWSRPRKNSAPPPPLYLTIGSSVPYCHSCGRVISERKKTKGPSEVKYCSSRCRNSKPGPEDRRIEATFAKMLDGATAQSLMAWKDDFETNTHDGHQKENENDDHSMKKKRCDKRLGKATKGDDRIIIDCSEVQEVVFQRANDPEKTFGRRKNRRSRYIVERPEDWKSVDMVDKPEPQSQSNHPMHSDSESSSDAQSSSSISDEEPKVQANSSIPDMVPLGYGSSKIRPHQSRNSINASIGGEKDRAERVEETDEMKERRREGQRIAEEREMVRRAARRGCAFGFPIEGGSEGKGEKSQRRMCEAVMKGAVVESSFAKGEWGIRWREK